MRSNIIGSVLLTAALFVGCNSDGGECWFCKYNISSLYISCLLSFLRRALRGNMDENERGDENKLNE